MEAAKKELGDGVVIMNVKSVKRKGLMALFRSGMTEVTVALEEEKDTKAFPRREGNTAAVRGAVLQGGRSVAGTGNPLRADDSMEDRASIERKLDNLQSLLVSRFQQSESERRELLTEEEHSDSLC